MQAYGEAVDGVQSLVAVTTWANAKGWRRRMDGGQTMCSWYEVAMTCYNPRSILCCLRNAVRKGMPRIHATSSVGCVVDRAWYAGTDLDAQTFIIDMDRHSGALYKCRP